MSTFQAAPVTPNGGDTGTEPRPQGSGFEKAPITRQIAQVDERCNGSGCGAGWPKATCVAAASRRPTDFSTNCSQPILANTPLLQRLAHAVGLDKAVLFTVLGKAWSTGAGLVTILAITHFLTPAQQGYYYTFASLVALQVVFELGFTVVILQLASHERAHLEIEGSEISGDPVAHVRLASVLKKTVSYYAVMAAVMAVVLIPAGAAFFWNTQHGPRQHGWLAPWCLVALMASANLFVTPLASFVEGCGFIAETARMRLGQAVLGSVLAWAALALHDGLFAPAMMIGGQVIWAARWLYGRRELLLHLLRVPGTGHALTWGRDIWPFQWRIAISWLTGYFIFQLFNPVLFTFQGPVAAGQMGISLSVATALANIGLAWINTKSAIFGSLVARKQYSELDRTFFRALAQSTILLAAASVLAWAVVHLCRTAFPAFGQRFLTSPALALLLGTTVLNHIVFSEAVYLRAHKRESFLALSILSAAVVGLTTLLLGRTSGAYGVTWGYFWGHGVLCVLAGTWIFQKNRRKWHSSVAEQ